MGFVELTLIAIGLSMDACAVSICKGLSMKKMNYRQALVIALFFGGFQALMPVLGWALGVQFQHYITSFDHWIAFVLLAFIGTKMLIDGIRNNNDGGCESCENPNQNSTPNQVCDAKSNTGYNLESSLSASSESNSNLNSGPSSSSNQKLDIKQLLMLAIATSIDALAVGITFAFLQVDIVPAVSLIGLITFALSFAGVVVGSRFGTKFERPATIVGGVVLILIGLKILLEHLGIFG